MTELSVVNESTIKPWDRQPGETPSAWDAFRHYRDMPTRKRTLPALRRLLEKEEEKSEKSGEFSARAPTYAQLATWSEQYNWLVRISAWDMEVDKVFQEETFAAARQAAKRHWESGIDMQEKGKEALEFIDPEALALDHPEEARKLIESGTEMERKALGMDREESTPEAGNALIIIQVVEQLEKKMQLGKIEEIEGEFREIN